MRKSSKYRKKERKEKERRKERNKDCRSLKKEKKKRNLSSRKFFLNNILAIVLDFMNFLMYF